MTGQRTGLNFRSGAGVVAALGYDPDYHLDRCGQDELANALELLRAPDPGADEALCRDGIRRIQEELATRMVATFQGVDWATRPDETVVVMVLSDAKGRSVSRRLESDSLEDVGALQQIRFELECELVCLDGPGPDGRPPLAPNTMHPECAKCHQARACERDECRVCDDATWYCCEPIG